MPLKINNEQCLIRRVSLDFLAANDAKISTCVFVTKQECLSTGRALIQIVKREWYFKLWPFKLVVRCCVLVFSGICLAQAVVTAKPGQNTEFFAKMSHSQTRGMPLIVFPHIINSKHDELVVLGC
jgi:hypothetical protein